VSIRGVDSSREGYPPTGCRRAASAPRIVDGGATSVSPGVTMTMKFSGPMAAGMEQYVDLHDGTAAGPLHSMRCTWSADRTTLTCVPGTPLQDNATYTLHLGAGMIAAGGGTADEARNGYGRTVAHGRDDGRAPRGPADVNDGRRLARLERQLRDDVQIYDALNLRLRLRS